jgi:hypothetical protein
VLDADEDLMSAMARELVEKAGVGESADSSTASVRNISSWCSGG